MSLQLYDTRSRRASPFQPLTPGHVSVYVCGPTVQAPPHIGHVRSAVVFDVLRRWLTVSGYAVTLARNVTDIEDKILAEAAATGDPWWAIVERNARAFAAAYAALNVLPPTVEPRATGHIPEMVALMRRLIDAGHAYAASGDVYFAVRSWPHYGELSGQRVDAMAPAEDVSSPGKRDPLDFALWKGAKPGEPAWDTPWGPGRPGWHLECSVMATKYLGPTFDIHGGGLDLVFPHHENEIAQSEAAGDPFARSWMHNGLVNIGAEKMSKSLGNSLLVSDLLERHRAPVLRYALTAPHYRSRLDWSEEALSEAAAAYGRIENFVVRGSELVGAVAPARASVDFAAAMDDDLGVPQALAVVHGRVRDGNAALASRDTAAVRAVLGEVRAMLDVLGLEPSDYGTVGGNAHATVIDALVRLVLQQREAARVRKDYAAADAIREALGSAGVVIEDTPSGPRWRVVEGR